MTTSTGPEPRPALQPSGHRQPLSKNALADAIMQEIAARPAVDWGTITPDAARAGQEAHAQPWNEPRPLVASIEDRSVPGPRGDVPVRVYRPLPPERQLAPQRPIIYAHGGGWATGSLETHDRACRLIALHSAHPVIAVDYGLSPEVPFPGARDDITATIAHLERGGFDSSLATDGYALAGDSSGAQIVLAAAANHAPGTPSFAANAKALGLIYPAVVHGFESASHHAFGRGAHGLSTERMQRFWQWYLEGVDPATARQADLSGMTLTDLPPTFIVAAGLDCLRDDAIALALHLTHAGRRFQLDHVEEMPHGFLLYSRALPDAEAMIARVSSFLARHLDG